MIPKFRYFNKLTKEMYTSGFYVTSDGRTIDTYDRNNPVDMEDVAVLMQSTGLKDKNGVEIFEGDIVKFTDYWDDFGPEGIEGDVEGHNFGEILITVDGPKIGRVAEIEGCVHERQNEERASFSELASSLDFEVIGNVHEHPHLLEEG